MMIEFHIQNLYTKVNKKLATKEELQAISKLLSLKVPGCYFSPAYKRGFWDGKKKFFNLLTGQFYTGLVNYTKQHLKDFEFKEIDERVRPVTPPFSLPILNGITYHKFQEEAIRQSVAIGRGIIAGPVNSGKTVMAAGIIKALGLPTNFITHRVNLLYQTREAFQNMLGIKVGILGDSECELYDVNVLSVVTLAQRLKAKDEGFEELLKLFPVVFSDECHHITAKGWEDTLKASGAFYRFGLSATALMRDDISNMTVLGLTGDEIFTITEQEMVDAGISARSSVYVYGVKQPKFQAHTPYSKVYDESIVYGAYRNSLVVKFAKHFLDQGKSVMVVVWRIAHGGYLEQLFQEAGIDARFIRGGSGSQNKLNMEVLKQFGEKKIKLVIASTIIDEGLNIPAMDVMINAVGDASPLKTTQRPGRGKRKKVFGENVLTIVDFMDLNNSHLKSHSLSRLEVYLNMKVPLYEVLDQEWGKVVPLQV